MSVPDRYLIRVKKLAVLMAKRRKLEKGGELGKGWFEAHNDLMKELRDAVSEFPGMDFDLMDDAAREVLKAAQQSRKNKTTKKFDGEDDE